MGAFLQFLIEQNTVGLNFEKKTASNINKWLSENNLANEFKASRFKPKQGQRSENFPDVCITKKDGTNFFIECKQYSRANMLNIRFDLDDNCNAVAKDEKYSKIANIINESKPFKIFRKFMTSKQKILNNLKPIDIYNKKIEFNPQKLIPKYNKLVRNGLVESDCKEFDSDVIRKSTSGAMACALAWRLINKGTWDICRIKLNFGPYLIGKYCDDANVKYIQIGENLFVMNENDNPLSLDIPVFPNKINGIFSLRFTPRFDVGGMYITPRSEITDKISSNADFNEHNRWPKSK